MKQKQERLAAKTDKSMRSATPMISMSWDSPASQLRRNHMVEYIDDLDWKQAAHPPAPGF